MNVADLPLRNRYQLCRLLDADGSWKTLGGLMGFKTHDISWMEHQEQGKSSSNQLLTIWGLQDHTVPELFLHLHKMNHTEAMEVLKNFVEESHHKLISEARP